MSNPVEDFLKEAGVWDALKHGLTLGAEKDLPGALKKAVPGTGERFAYNAGKMTGNGALGAGIVGGVSLLGKGGDSLYDAATSGLHHRAEHSAMMQAHPSLKEEDPREVEMVLQSVRHLSPSLSSDPLVAGSLVRNILAYGRTEQGLTMPPDTAKMLADTQSKMVGRGNSKSLLDVFGTSMGSVKEGPVTNNKVLNTVQNFDPSIRASTHQWFDEQGNPKGDSERRDYER
jgi:hypothetical protein